MSKYTEDDLKKELETKEYEYGFYADIESDKLPVGLNEEIIVAISKKKEEPEWMTDWRLDAFKKWKEMKEPEWANVKYDKPDLQKIYWDDYASEIMGNSPALEENVKQMKAMIEWGEEVGITFVCVTSQKPRARYHTAYWLGKHELNFDTIYFRRGIDKPNTPVDFLVDDSPNNYH